MADITHRQLRRASQRGVTLIELMVGAMIGMLAVLIISQVLLVSEGQKRTTTAGADSQVNGAVALYTMQRDVQMAGYGVTSSPNVVGCPITARFNGAAIAGFPTTLAPVVITPAAIGDSVRVLASSKTSYTVPTRVSPGFAINDLTFPVTSSLGFAQGDLALVAENDTQPCWVYQVTAAPTPNHVPRADQPTRWNAVGTPNRAYPDGSVLINLGSLIDNQYEVVLGPNGSRLLQVSSFDAGNPGTRQTRDIQTEIVGLRAFYGRDTSVTRDDSVDVFDSTTPTTNDGWQRVLSVRMLIVARSGQYEKDPVTLANPTWDVGTVPPTTGAAACGASECIEIDVGANVVGSDAQHYRYKVFETIVPLRNMLWRSGP